MNKPFSFLAAIFLWIVAAAHVIRIIFHVPIVIANIHVPLWLSIFPIIILPLIAIMLRKESKT